MRKQKEKRLQQEIINLIRSFIDKDLTEKLCLEDTRHK